MPNGSQYQTVQTGYAGPWVDQVLQALGAPTTDSNRAALRAWAASEGTVTSNNPLAFSGTYPGATTCIAQCGSSSPIMAYSSANQGATNTAAFILGNSSYASIVQAFRSDAGLQTIFGAINSSPWCAGCQSGSYPTALHAAAGGATGGSAAPPGAAAGNGGQGGGSGTGGPCGSSNPAPVFSIKLLGTVLDQCQALKIKGGFLMVVGGFGAVIGLGMILATLGLQTKAGRTAAEVVPGGLAVKALAGSGTSTQRSRGQASAQRQADRMQLAQERGSQQRATAAAKQTASAVGAKGGARIPKADSKGRVTYHSEAEKAKMSQEGFEEAS